MRIYSPLRTLLGAVFCGLTLGTSAQTIAENGQVQITLEDLQAETQRLPAETRAMMLSRPETLKQITNNLLIRRQLAYTAAQQGLERDPKVAATLQIMRDKTLAEQYLERQSQQNKPGDKALDQYAQALYKTLPKNQTEEPESVHVRHILIGKDDPDAKAKATQLLEQIKKGASFEALAKEHSKDPGSASKGGDLGFISRNQTVKPFEDAAFGLKQAGDLSAVVESNFGQHIIQFVARKPARTKTFDEMREPLRAQALAKHQSEQQSRLLEEAQAHVKFDEAALNELAQSFVKKP